MHPVLHVKMTETIKKAVIALRRGRQFGSDDGIAGEYGKDDLSIKWSLWREVAMARRAGSLELTLCQLIRWSCWGEMRSQRWRMALHKCRRRGKLPVDEREAEVAKKVGARGEDSRMPVECVFHWTCHGGGGDAARCELLSDVSSDVRNRSAGISVHHHRNLPYIPLSIGAVPPNLVVYSPLCTRCKAICNG